MKVIIENRQFPYEIGVRMLKARHGTCTFPVLSDVWESIPELSFGFIISQLQDPVRRRIAFSILPIHKMLEELKPVLVRRETVVKKTKWIDSEGKSNEREYDDTYELYRVGWVDLYRGLDPEKSRLRATGLTEDQHFVKFRDTSSSKEHLIWIDIREVFENNATEVERAKAAHLSNLRLEKHVNPIQAIAWTIMTDVAPMDVEAVIRQGDCVLVKKRPGSVGLEQPRHLTEHEYRNLLIAES